MFKKRPTKAELRDQLNAEVSQFLQKGGKIQCVDMGESGLVDGRYTQYKGGFERTQPQERTPVHGLLATIDSRRKQKSRPIGATTKRSTPQKKVIYDDFGEPIRTIWVED